MGEVVAWQQHELQRHELDRLGAQAKRGGTHNIVVVGSLGLLDEPKDEHRRTEPRRRPEAALGKVGTEHTRTAEKPMQGARLRIPAEPCLSIIWAGEYNKGW